MLILDLLSKLPTGLLLSSLALAANALPVGSVELKVLTPDDFESTVAQGAWFIEHFSPYCHHCRAFAPTWEKLVEHYEAMGDPGVHLAQVDCAVNGDLCNQHGVKGYPQMNMYVNGEMVDKFKGVRDWDSLTSFIENHAVHTSTPAEEVELSGKPISEQQKQQTPTIHTDKLKPNPEGMVKALGPTNFDATLNSGPVFIKFFAPWCGHCKKLAPTWTELAAHMRNQLTIAEVNCEIFKDLCKTQGIQGFPSLFYYSGGSGPGMHKAEYTGGRKFDQLKRFAETAVASSVVEVKTEADYEHYVEESPVLYLFLHAPGDTQALSRLAQTSHILLGSPKILTSSSPELRHKFSIPPAYTSTPVLLSIKDNIPHAYTSLFSFSPAPPSPSTAKVHRESLQEWLLLHRLPSALELNQETFQDVMSAASKPLVVIAAFSPGGGEGHAEEKMKSAAREWRNLIDREKSGGGSGGMGLWRKEREREVVFTWMDGEKWASWMKSMYGIKDVSVTDPRVVVADHQKLVYYDTNAKGSKIVLDAQSVTEAVRDVLSGHVSYKHSENILERTARGLNDLLTSLETTIYTHPYRAALAFLGFIVGLVWLIKRLVTEDIPSSYVDYTRLQKDGNRID
ncbi:thioredoxin-domain-containing protein [Fomitiporia mediterranea MF3/22]|uniref:thioredoxin-domain-containing protein n=1 Tax=Fomitiporia mediterranea (strain MF3/22) TaxID=694068 RepID=UPI0004407E47|nr:thioredoxin-domain-containing protein [Fomitiporia mediterranea MF3/22]EJD00787.1 thioredoxin-domain-containing protein [Fomitiporia mediterranea MF3/22]